MVYVTRSYTAQKMKFSIMEFFSKCDQIRRKLQIWSHLLKRSLMENFVFCAVKIQYRTCRVNERQVCRQSKSVSLVYKACSPCDVNVVTESNRSGRVSLFRIRLTIWLDFKIFQVTNI